MDQCSDKKSRDSAIHSVIELGVSEETGLCISRHDLRGKGEEFLEPVPIFSVLIPHVTPQVTGKDDPFISFPTKASGLDELLDSVARYPQDTLFYLDAWTFGYEDVWQTLSNFLDSRIHVDDYRYGLYRSLANGIDPKAPEAAKLVGFQCGNHFQEGCLTTNTVGCRIHSCEKGTRCEIWSQGE